MNKITYCLWTENKIQNKRVRTSNRRKATAHQRLRQIRPDRRHRRFLIACGLFSLQTRSSLVSDQLEQRRCRGCYSVTAISADNHLDGCPSYLSARAKHAICVSVASASNTGMGKMVNRPSVHALGNVQNVEASATAAFAQKDASSQVMEPAVVAVIKRPWLLMWHLLQHPKPKRRRAMHQGSVMSTLRNTCRSNMVLVL